MKNVLTKKGVLALSLVGIAWWLFLFLTNSILFSTGGHCHMYYVGWCNFASKTIEHTVAYTNPFFPLFLLSLITYFMRDGGFRFPWCLSSSPRQKTGALGFPASRARALPLLFCPHSSSSFRFSSSSGNGRTLRTKKNVRENDFLHHRRKIAYVNQREFLGALLRGTL